MKTSHAMTRRRFLKASAGGVAAALLAGCTEPVAEIVRETVVVETEKVVEKTVEVQTEVEKVVTATPSPSRYQQNPIWDAAVAKGELPPVDQRLPLEPCVAPRSGVYGGVPVLGATSQNFQQPLGITYYQSQPPMRPMEDGTLVPNLFKDVVYSEDYKSLTCYMRAGVKWSDGAPYTADDWVFWFEDYMSDEVLQPAFSTAWGGSQGGMTLTKLDDYSFRIDWNHPRPLQVMQRFAHSGAFKGVMPKHYMKEFHIRYNPEADEQAIAEGYAGWGARFTEMSAFGKNPDRPSLLEYVFDEVTVDAVTMKPNPYFWMVDQDGRQLPYFDGAVRVQCADASVVEAKILTGELDVGSFGFQDYQTFKEGEEAGNYKIKLWRKQSNMAFSFNMTYEDAAWREVFRDVRFRRAMSVALDRDKANDLVYMGLCTPGQFTAHPSCQAFKQEYLDAWAQYNPDLANQFLDEIGLKWDDSHELRLLADGRPMTIDFLVAEGSANVPHLDLCIEDWANIGIKVNYKLVTRALLSENIRANKCMMAVWGACNAGGQLLMVIPNFFAAGSGDENCIGQPWGKWYTSGGTQGEEPPDWMKQLFEWHDQWAQTGDWDVVDKVLAYQAENLLQVGTLWDTPSPQIYNEDIANVPESLISDWDNDNGPYAYMECFYFDR